MIIPNSPFVVLVIFSALAGLTSAFSDYGEFCNKTTRCEPSAYLTCQNETCQCIKPEAMMFDQNLKQCVALVGEKCRFTVGTADDNYWYEAVGCVQYAICAGEAGICSCLPHFIDHKNGTCSEKGGFGASCQETKACRADLGLSCIEGTCTCDAANAIDSQIAYGNNFTGRECLGLAGKPCLHHKCTANAHCSEVFLFNGPPESRQPMCQCIPPFSATQDGLCLAGHGYPCSSKSPCADDFACVDQRCLCKHPLHQVFDQFTGTCKSLVWGPCSNNGGNQSSQCVDGAVCMEHSQGYMHCECDKDFVENEEGGCDLGFGGDCETNSYRKCDQLASLTCRLGKCACIDDLQVYDPSTRKCKGLVGTICTSNEQCVSKAVCEINKDSLGRPGGRKTCGCAEGAQPGEDRMCT